ADFTRRDQAFEAVTPNDRIELWFETDLHDQLQVIQFLARIAAKGSAPAMWLTLAPPPLPSHIEKMEGMLASVSAAQIAEAVELWDAFCAPTPEAMLSLSSNNGALPDARAALGRMLEEIPGGDGLSRIERHALRAVKNGAGTPGLAFRDYHPTEELPFLGDLGFLYRLEQLGNCSEPLVHGLPKDGIAHAVRNNMSVEYVYTPITLSEAGNAVLEGSADFIALNGIDRWV